MIYGGVPVNSMKVKHYELNTNDCDMIASDLQAGKTAVARGKKITGTGKSFEFAYYGDFTANTRRYVPSNINVVDVSSTEYPVKLSINLLSMQYMDFSGEQKVAKIIIDNNEYDLTVSVQSSMLKISCEKNVRLQVFYGKDNYV